jgi:acetyl-CoA C-acetyltransferase
MQYQRSTACLSVHVNAARHSPVFNTLLNAMEKYGQDKGVASLCIGGGEATAVAVERMM